MKEKSFNITYKKKKHVQVLLQLAAENKTIKKNLISFRKLMCICN